MPARLYPARGATKFLGRAAVLLNFTFFVMLGLPLRAQPASSASLKGQVSFARTGENLERARVSIDGTEREAFTDAEVFDLEMKHIFESTWVFLGLASQLKEPNDFFTTWIGRQPVIVSRDVRGKIHCLLNTCRHRGAILCHTRQGNERHHICQYHGWAYDSAGKCVIIKDEADALYPEGFGAESHDLV